MTVLYKFSPIDKTTGGATEAEPNLETTSWKALVNNSLTAAQLTDNIKSDFIKLSLSF